MLQRLELGFAISYPLAMALDKMQDKCLQRYTLHSLGLMIGSKLLWQSLVSLSFVTLAFTRLITLYPAFIGFEIPKIPTQCSAFFMSSNTNGRNGRGLKLHHF